MTSPSSSPDVTGAPPAGTDNNTWKLHGACVGEDQDFWFPAAYESNATARRICAGCVVRVDCLEYALGLNIQHGIWGGLSIQERRKIRVEGARARLASPSAATARATGGVPSAARAETASALPCAGRAAHHP